jgi:hypothetical protein
MISLKTTAAFSDCRASSLSLSDCAKDTVLASITSVAAPAINRFLAPFLFISPFQESSVNAPFKAPLFVR